MADRDLLAGQGISLDASIANQLKVNAQISPNVIVVTDDSKFPNVVGGVSTLPANTVLYLPAGSTYSVRIETDQPGCGVIGDGIFSVVTYTGADDFITSSESIFVRSISIMAVTASNVCKCSAVDPGVFSLALEDVQFLMPLKCGSLHNFSLVGDNFIALNMQDGWSLSSTGVIPGFKMGPVYMVDNNVNAVHFDLGSATFLGFDFIGVKMSGLGTYLKSSSGGEGNMSNGIEAVVYNCNFGYGSGTALDGFNDSWFTNNWNFRDNSPNFATENTRQVGDLYLTTQNTIDVAVVDTWYEIGTPAAGAWESKVTERFVADPAGFLRYVGSRPIEVTVLALSTVEKVGGGSDYVVQQIARNWNPGNSGELESQGGTDNSSPTGVTSSCFLVLQPNDTIRTIFNNKENPTDVLSYTTRLQVIGG